MHYQCDVENENEEEIKHRSNISYAQDDDEAVFKRPKPKVSLFFSCIIVITIISYHYLLT